MTTLSAEILEKLVQSSPDGVVVCERGKEDWSVIFANSAFEKLTGYTAAELKGRALSLFQGSERDQEPRQRITQAFAAGEGCRVLLRNQKSDGAQFWHEITLAPLRNGSGEVTHFVSFHRDAGERMRMETKPPAAREKARPSAEGTTPPGQRDDRVTGLHTRDYFDELMRRDWSIALRDGRRLALLLFDIDCLNIYNETFGRAAGDSCIKRVARAISGCLRRGSDLTARLEGGTIVALVHSVTLEQLMPFANSILERVREQHIHHPRSTVQKYVTVSGGVVSIVPGETDQPELLLERAQKALRVAKHGGRNRIAGSEMGKG